jgi:hypothetical protein
VRAGVDVPRDGNGPVMDRNAVHGGSGDCALRVLPYTIRMDNAPVAHHPKVGVKPGMSICIACDAVHLRPKLTGRH